MRLCKFFLLLVIHLVSVRFEQPKIGQQPRVGRSDVISERGTWAPVVQNNPNQPMVRISKTKPRCLTGHLAQTDDRVTNGAPEDPSCDQRAEPRVGDRRLAPKGDKVAGIPTLGPGVPCISQRIVDPQRRQTLLTGEAGMIRSLNKHAWEKQL